MTRTRKFLVGVSAATLLAVAGPGFGAPQPNKVYTLTVSPGVPDVTQQGTRVTATITNVSPKASSASIGSLILSVNPVSGLGIVNVEPVTDASAPSITFDATNVTVTGLASLKPGESLDLLLDVSGCGDGNTWSAAVWSGSNLSGDTFHQVNDVQETNLSCGAIACGGNLTGAAVGSIFDSESMRGPYNQDGTCSLDQNPVDYFVTLLDTEGYLHVRWESEPAAAFYYKINTPTPSPVRLAWETDDGTPDGVPIFLEGDGLKCDDSMTALPAPYGSLVSDKGGKQIKVNTSTAVYALPPVPFPIMIGPKPILEYMMVTKVSGDTWTVARGTSPHQHPASTSTAPTYVMSTPLPLLQAPVACVNSDGSPYSGTCPYTAGTPAQMCYVPPPVGDYHTYVFDIGDGYVGIE
jgi:hypothetical protein